MAFACAAKTECLDEVLSRWEYTKLRAEQDGGFIMNIEASAVSLTQILAFGHVKRSTLCAPSGTGCLKLQQR